ncbi:MAG: putative Ig domain-containing protein [Pseudomonadota bacterium]
MPFNPTLARLSPFERLLSLFTSVRPGEGRSVCHLFVSGFLLMFAYYLLKPVREALILSEGSAELRAYVVGIVAVTLVFVIPLYNQLFRGLTDPERKSRVLRWIIAFFMTNLLMFWGLGLGGFDVGIPYFVWLSIFNVMVIAQFWAFAADLYNTRSGQRLFPVIMVGLSIGAWAGASSAGMAFDYVGPFSIMILAAALLLAPMGLSVLAERGVPDGSAANDPEEEPESAPIGFASVIGGFEVVFRSRYLLLLAGLMFLLNMINTTGEFIVADYVKGWATAEATRSGIAEARLIGQVMASYYAWISLLSMLIQLFIVSRVFRHLGVRGAVLVLPIFMLAHYAILLVLPTFFLVRWLMVSENAINYSMQNTTTQALYLPLTREEKYVGKTTIDTFFVRFGDLAQAGLVFAGLNLLGWSMGGFVVVNLVLAIGLLLIALALRRSHRTVIKEKLVNLPPEIIAPLPSVHVPSGHLLMFSVPDECFFDPDPGDVLEYSAVQTSGDALPTWVRFDRYNQTFTVKPPRTESGGLEVELTATDFEGLKVSGRFLVHYAPAEVPSFDPPPATAE